MWPKLLFVYLSIHPSVFVCTVISVFLRILQVLLIENILKSNGLDSSQATNFIMQDVESLLSKSPQYVNSLARFATESSDKLNRLVEGEGKKKKRGRPKKSNTYISKTNKRIKNKK